MSKKKKKNQHKKKKLQNLLCLFLVTLILSFAYIMVKEKKLEPDINELTASYISFNNNNVTDRLTISNLKVMPDIIGKSTWNKSRLTIPITGEQNQEYEIILSPTHQETNEEYIEIYLEHKKEKIRKKMSEFNNTSAGEKIIYQGKIDHSNISIYMWISSKYKLKKDHNSYEIKIRSR